MVYLDQTRAPTRARLDARSGLIVVEFGVDWCGYCIAAAPHTEALLARHPEVEHIKVEDGRGRPLGRSFGVKLWPTFVLMRDGAVVHQLARPDPAALTEALRDLTAS
jgi:thioredoxin 1